MQFVHKNSQKKQVEAALRSSLSPSRPEPSEADHRAPEMDRSVSPDGTITFKEYIKKQSDPTPVFVREKVSNNGLYFLVRSPSSK
jgi:hypothetical protein